MQGSLIHSTQELNKARLLIIKQKIGKEACKIKFRLSQKATKIWRNLSGDLKLTKETSHTLEDFCKNFGAFLENMNCITSLASSFATPVLRISSRCAIKVVECAVVVQKYFLSYQLWPFLWVRGVKIDKVHIFWEDHKIL